MGVRTKVLVTVATVATMTAIGTTKAYGLEDTLLNNIEKTQALANEDKVKYVDTDNNVKNKIHKKNEILINSNKKKSIDKIKQKTNFNKETNESNFQKKSQLKFSNDNNKKNELKIENKQEIFIENNILKEQNQKNSKKNKEDIKKQFLYKNSNSNFENINLNLKEEKKESNIVEAEVVDVVSKLNIRESPSLNAPIIGRLSLGEKIKIDKNHSNAQWYGICFGEHGGFVSAKYIKLRKTINDNKEQKKDNEKNIVKDKNQNKVILGKVINISSNLNVRENPTINSKIIGKLYEGNEVSINKEKSKDGWYEILFKNSKGYVSANYIKIINKDYLISDNLVKFVSSYEGYSAIPYRGADYQNKTIGYGHVIMPGETYSYLTELEARNLLKSDLNIKAIKVKAILDKKDIKLNTYQFDSLVSFAYNCGVQGLSNSRLLKNIKNKANLEEIKDAFLAWRYCNGIELQGLKKRRIEEFEIYSKGDYVRNL